MAMRLGWHPSKVTNIEKGKARASEIDLVQFLTMCDKDIDFFENFRRRYKYAFDEYVVQVHENCARSRSPSRRPRRSPATPRGAYRGWCRRRSTRTALYRVGGFVAEERIPNLVRFRIERQAILRRHDRPTCVFFVHELALRQKVGDDQIMEDQYARMLFSGLDIRIVPADVVVPSSGCVLWSYEKAASVVYCEADLVNVFVQDPGAIARTRLLFDHLEQVALDAGQSRTKLAEYVSPPREEFDGRGPRLA